MNSSLEKDRSTPMTVTVVELIMAMYRNETISIVGQIVNIINYVSIRLTYLMIL